MFLKRKAELLVGTLEKKVVSKQCDCSNEDKNPKKN